MLSLVQSRKNPISWGFSFDLRGIPVISMESLSETEFIFPAYNLLCEMHQCAIRF